MSKELKEVMEGKTPFIPLRAITIAQDANGVVLISAQKMESLAVVMDLLLQGVNQCWEQLKSTPIVVPISRAEHAFVPGDSGDGTYCAICKESDRHPLHVVNRRA